MSDRLTEATGEIKVFSAASRIKKAPGGTSPRRAKEPWIFKGQFYGFQALCLQSLNGNTRLIPGIKTSPGHEHYKREL